MPFAGRCDIQHLDLAVSASPPPTVPFGHSKFVVFWWHHVPLGQVEIAASMLPIAPSAWPGVVLGAIARAARGWISGQEPADHWPGRPHNETPKPDPNAAQVLSDLLLALRACRSMDPNPTAPAPASAAVVIPTRDRPEALRACLESIRRLAVAPRQVVVVDNAPSNPDTRRVTSEFSGVKYIEEPRRGVSFARNTGVAHTQSEFVLFADDDEVVHPQWSASLLRCFCEPRVGIATGLVLPVCLDTRAQQVFEQRFGFGRGYVRKTFGSDFYRQYRYRGVPTWRIGGSGNFAIRRSTFDRLGGFDPRLGGGAAGSCEDLELFHRALARGVACVYEPRALVYHSHRAGMRSLALQLRDYFRGRVVASWIERAAGGSFGSLRQILVTLPADLLRSLALGLSGHPAYPLVLWRAQVSGSLAGTIYYLVHRRVRDQLAARAPLPLRS